MTEIILHKFGNITFSYITHSIALQSVDKKGNQVKTNYVGKTLGEKFILDIKNIKALAQDGNNCNKSRCTWCPICYNKVATHLNIQTISL